jgi:hypothetical protein
MLQARLLMIWQNSYGLPPDARICGGNVTAVKEMEHASQGWLTVGMKKLFKDAALSRQRKIPMAYPLLENIAMLWAIKGPQWNHKQALQNAAIGNLEVVSKDLSLGRLVSEIPDVRLSFQTGRSQP